MSPLTIASALPVKANLPSKLLVNFEPGALITPSSTGLIPLIGFLFP